MKEVLKRIVYPLIVFVVAASCSAPRYASAQDDGYYDNNNNYSNNDNSYNNNNYNNDQYNNDDASNSYDEPADVNINTFNDALTPYGSWVVSASYGRCWVPGYSNFVPYSTGGHWVYSSYGWTWASDYSWGWAPFHYGRWAYDAAYGWMWAPGYQWGPAWVAWRSGGGYYGWSPLGPSMGIGINIGFGIPYNQWVFAPCRYMGYGNINHYYVRPSYNTTIIHNTTIINNTTVYNNRTFVAGPNRVEVERYSGRQVNQVRVVNASAPGRTVINNNNTIQIYRPGMVQRSQQVNQGNMQANANRNNQVNQQNQINRGTVQDDRNTQQMNTPQRNMMAPDVRDRMNNNRRPDDFADVQQGNGGDPLQNQAQRNPQQNQMNNTPQRDQQNMQDQRDRMMREYQQQQQQQQMANRSNNDQQQQQRRMQNNPPERMQQMNNDQFNGRQGRQQDFNQQQQRQQNFNQQRQEPSYRQPQQQGGNEGRGRRN